ncbi:hypothetical protein NC651_026778 [Populus alba x Populus x berolinensis]|nr:hypothetical protein NC651_026778 [Populus alba x Populus x berolinensis]
MSDAKELIIDRQCPRREWMSSGFSFLLWDEEERRGGHMKRPRHEKGVFRVLTVFLDIFTLLETSFIG